MAADRAGTSESLLMVWGRSPRHVADRQREHATHLGHGRLRLAHDRGADPGRRSRILRHGRAIIQLFKAGNQRPGELIAEGAASGWPAPGRSARTRK